MNKAPPRSYPDRTTHQVGASAKYYRKVWEGYVRTDLGQQDRGYRTKRPSEEEWGERRAYQLIRGTLAFTGPPQG